MCSSDLNVHGSEPLIAQPAMRTLRVTIRALFIRAPFAAAVAAIIENKNVRTGFDQRRAVIEPMTDVPGVAVTHQIGQMAARRIGVSWKIPAVQFDAVSRGKMNVFKRTAQFTGICVQSAIRLINLSMFKPAQHKLYEQESGQQANPFHPRMFSLRSGHSQECVMRLIRRRVRFGLQRIRNRNCFLKRSTGNDFIGDGRNHPELQAANAIPRNGEGVRKVALQGFCCVSGKGTEGAPSSRMRNANHYEQKDMARLCFARNARVRRPSGRNRWRLTVSPPSLRTRCLVLIRTPDKQLRNLWRESLQPSSLLDGGVRRPQIR